MSYLPTFTDPLSSALFALSIAGFLFALLLLIRARRAVPPRPNPKKEPFFPLHSLPQLPESERKTPAPSLTFDEEWLIPTKRRRTQPPRLPSEGTTAVAVFAEPPTRRDRPSQLAPPPPPPPRRCPFDVPTVSYPSSLSVARMYARSILQETGAR